MPRSKTFAEIVTEVEDAPARPPDLRANGVLAAPDGTVFERLDVQLSVTRANELITAGATVAIDDCGCSGYCSVEWTAKSAVKSVPATRKPKKGAFPFANLEEWQSRNGATMVLISGPDFIRPGRQ